MPKITSLVKDIQNVLEKGAEVSRDTIEAFGQRLADIIAKRLVRRQDRTDLRASNLGTPCDRKLWYTINSPEKGEKLSASTLLKFTYGAILEELILFLAKVSGHEVTDEQREVDINGVKGHIDGRIDGELVDVKSASTPSFAKFKQGLDPSEDSFGYLDQLGIYGFALGTDRGHFLAVDKQHGHLTLDTHRLPKVDYNKVVDEKRNLLSRPTPPPRGFEDQSFQASGNRKLGLNCSYCDFKRDCWPGLRAFDYSGKPVFLSKVVREPGVREIDLKDDVESD